VATLATSVLVAWASITLTQNTMWRDDITLWSETARLEPDSYKAHFNLGVALGQKGRYVEAEEQLKATIRRWPAEGKPYYALGKIYVDQEKNEQAVEFLRRALPNLRPYWSAWAQFNLGLIYQRQKLREQAKAAYLEAIRLRPNFPLALNNLGLLLDSEGNYTDAGNAFHQAIASDPTYASPHYNLGLLYQRQNLREQAKAAYREAIRLEPNSPKALNNLGLLWVSEGNYARGEEAFRRAVAADPSYARAHFNLGQTYERQGLKEQAKAAYREAIRLEQTYTKALNNLGILLESEGNYAKAEDAFLRAIAADARHARAHYNLAQLYLKHLGAPKKALHHLEEVIRLEPNHPRIEQIRALARQLRRGG
ncbi:MAG: tetratricopeptide repeat protein, partial [bacterium]|nr:tetratricopeptide repeat protein [bacterium]